MLEEAILMAGTRRESRSPVMINPIKAGEEREVSLSGIQLSPVLAEIEDLPRQLKPEINVDIIPTEEQR
jgi:hypothetical protein